MRWPLLAVCVVACRGSAPHDVSLTPRRAVQRAAQPGPASCARPGQWRFALIAPLYSPVEDITAAELDAMLRGTTMRTLAMSAATRAVLGAAAGPELTVPTETQWSVVPAHELVPHWQVVTVDGVHPLARDATTTALTATVCADDNIDPRAVTTVAMTGVTAMTRYTATLMDRKGVTYPARDVASWFAGTDFVHASNEVSFTPTCEPKADPTVRAFCSRDGYIELLAALHVNIVEQTGSHLLDFGTTMLRRTIEMYEARNWRVFGGGRDQLEATRPLLVEHNGNKLAFIGCNMPRSTSETIRNGPNVAFCDYKRLDWQLADLRKRGYLPIVSIQHEEVRGHEPAFTVVRDFRHLAEAGATVVFGSQAHVAHPFEVHANSYVHYGAGNFIFDQPWGSTRDATADRFYFHRGKLLSVRRLFTRIEEQGRPRPMTDAERAGFLRTLDAARAALAPARPWAAPRPQVATRTAPDSFLVGKLPVFVRVTAPAKSATTYPLVIALSPRAAATEHAFTVSLRARPGLRQKRLVRAITEFMASKYPIDTKLVTIR